MSYPQRTIGNFALGALIGRGGTSEVYAAEHRFLGTSAAIKVLRSELVDSDRASAAFLDEAKRTRAIDHPNVVRVLDFGRDAGVLYLVMERVDGESLAARLRHDKRLDEPTVRAIGAGIADGIAAAHALGIIHCDLKPGNVVLAGDRPKVVDFGIAHHLGRASGPRMGTPAYMAPEQIDGDVVAPSVDIWALGVVLFEALTGQVPFEATADSAPQLRQPAPRPSTRAPCSPELDALIVACLDRDPARRPPSMLDVAEALRGLTDERITQAVGPAPTPPAPPPRRRTWIPAVIGGGLVVVAIVVWQLAAPGDEPAPIAPPPPPPRVVVAQAPAVDASVAPPVDAATTSSIAVRSTPAGATIVIAGQARGRTPATLEIALPVDIELRHRGFRTAHTRATKPGTVEVHLVRVPPGKCPIPPCETLD
jgi:tRNA A-37 threonylcarbamoyl transferase component Bud32